MRRRNRDRSRDGFGKGLPQLMHHHFGSRVPGYVAVHNLASCKRSNRTAGTGVYGQSDTGPSTHVDSDSGAARVADIGRPFALRPRSRASEVPRGPSVRPRSKFSTAMRRISVRISSLSLGRSPRHRDLVPIPTDCDRTWQDFQQAGCADSAGMM